MSVASARPMRNEQPQRAVTAVGAAIFIASLYAWALQPAT
jgi:hypothetical protein